MKFELNLTKNELNRVFAKFNRLRKTLKQIKSQRAEKSLCLTRELTNDNDETKNKIVLEVFFLFFK